MAGLKRCDYDAVVVGSGPNGLAAAITLQQHGCSVLLIEGKDTIGGGMRTAELTLPGFSHDVCSAIHPMAAASPFFKSLPLAEHGLEFLQPVYHAAHPLDGGSAAVLKSSVLETAASLGADRQAYLDIMLPFIQDWPLLASEILAPFHIPGHPLVMARFGMNALKPATFFANRFKTKEARGLWGGMAAHAIQPLSNVATSAIGMVLMGTAHTGGWPMAKGGASKIGDALLSYFISLGGKLQLNFYIQSLKQLPSSNVVLFDVTPKQLLAIAGEKLSALYSWQLKRYRYGMGVFKIDWALDDQIPFTADECRQAGTIHLGNTFEEIEQSEKAASSGGLPEKPFVLLAQQSIFDASRAPAGKHMAWAYCHVPNGSTADMTDAIENQVERFAPGFKDTILARATMNTSQIEAYNPNYIGGDINGGVIDIGQLFTRPAIRWSPYQTPAQGLYICSSSTPPGGGVHGMCGYHAARKALRDVFGVSLPNDPQVVRT